jgi:methyl-accepting chemotaxis protein
VDRLNAFLVRLPRALRHPGTTLPALLVLLATLGLAVEVAFQHDQQRRLDALDPAHGIAARLLGAGQEAFRVAPGDGDGPDAVLALQAAYGVAGALADELERSPPALGVLPAAPATVALAVRWRQVEDQAGALLALARAGEALRRQALTLESALIRMRVNSHALLQALVVDEAKAVQLGAAARQLALAERLAGGARSLALGEELLAFADRVGRDAVAFGDALNTLENGSPELKIPRVTGVDARDILTGLGREFRQVVPLLEPVLDQAARRPELSPSLSGLAAALEAAAEEERSVRVALAARAQRRVPQPLHLLWLTLLVLLSGAAALRSLQAQRRRQEEGAAESEASAAEALLEAERERDARRDALQRIADRLARVADGDADLDRAMTDAVDTDASAAFAALERVLDRLRESNDRGLRLMRGGAALAHGTRDLREQTRRQGECLDQLSMATRDMAAGLDPLSRDRLEAGEAARSSGAEARRASASVSEALNELEALQGAAEHCAQRVQRLESAAREMLSVRELVEDVSELGKLLSLNVAIQASVDQSASQVLGAFAGEVQRLSERARGAMLRVDSVHQELRDEAGRAARAIDDSLMRARSAVSRARAAGAGLTALDEAARRLEIIGERLEQHQREHARRVTAVVRSITAVHRVTGSLRQQVDVAVDSSLALVDSGASLSPAVSTPPARVLPLHGDVDGPSWRGRRYGDGGDSGGD